MSTASLTVDQTGVSARTNLLRSVFSFPVMLASLLVVLAMLTVRGRFDDPDMWWHLKTGEVIWSTHADSDKPSFFHTLPATRHSFPRNGSLRCLSMAPMDGRATRA